jgi:hypothetical protein
MHAAGLRCTDFKVLELVFRWDLAKAQLNDFGANTAELLRTVSGLGEWTL